MENFDFIDAVEIKKAYKTFIDGNGRDIENIFDNLNNFIKDAFHNGFRAGKESGAFEGQLKAKMNIVINLIKLTNLNENEICKFIEIDEANENWIRFIKDTRGKLR